jgi:hypothetical protein
MRRRLVSVLVVVGCAVMPFASAPTAVAGQSGASPPKPPARGTWTVHDGQALASGSMRLVKSHGHLEITGFHGRLNSFYASQGCGPGAFTVKGSYRVHRITVKRTHQQVWIVGKKWGARIGPGVVPDRATISYAGKTVHAGLVMTFANHRAPKVGQLDFTNGVDLINFANHGCELGASLKHK